MKPLSAHEPAILAAVRAVPAGSVAAYGEIARRAGLPRRARFVAQVLARASIPDLPWHRIVRADGRIAFPPGSRGFREQMRRLRAEGVPVSKEGRIGRQKSAPPEPLDKAIWALE